MADTIPTRRFSAVSCLATCFLFAAGSASAQSDGYVLFLDRYLSGDYYYAPLGDVDAQNPRYIRPRRLRLPSSFRRNLEIGNADVSPDGTTIVFAARRTDDYDWDIYTGTLDLSRNRIQNPQLLIGNAGSRDEDPRYSWDGSAIVYKCAGNICIYPDMYGNPALVSWCELWAPSFSPTGFAVTFVKRCGAGDSDRVWEADLATRAETVVPNASEGPDRFPFYLDDGRLVYSHLDNDSGQASLWIHDTGFAAELHDRTRSDDDPYPDKNDRNHIAFIGWNDSQNFYDLYVYRRASNDSVRLSRGTPVLGPVLFRR